MDMQNVSNLVIPEGEVRTIHDKDSRLLWGSVSYSVKYSGDTAQDGTPTPDSPVSIQTVTGEQTVTIDDGVDSEDFIISLGSTELCKIGDYQDYIYKSGDDWYVQKQINKIVYDGTQNWYAQPSGNQGRFYAGVIADAIRVADNIEIKSDYFYYSTSPTLGSGLLYNGRVYLCYGDSNTTAANFKTWLASNNTTIYYPIATPTDTQITDATLVGQLNAVHEWLTRYGYNATVTGNLPIIINKTNL